MDPDGRCSRADNYSGCGANGTGDLLAALVMPARTFTANGVGGDQVSGVGSLLAALAMPARSFTANGLPPRSGPQPVATSPLPPQPDYSVYDHTLDFIYGAMKSNSTSPLVPHWCDLPQLGIGPIQISPCDSYNDAVLAYMLFRFMPRGKCPTFHGTGLTLFYNPAISCGDWDQKPDIASIFRTYSSISDASLMYMPVRGDSRPERVFYDVWSNIHYGYVGRSMGVPHSWLMTAQMNPFAGVSDPGDNLSVLTGMLLWDYHGSSLTKAQLQAMIVSAMPGWRDLDKGQGWQRVHDDWQ